MGRRSMAKRDKKSITSFIALVKKHSCLWNVDDECYGSIQLKGKIWEKIAKQHGLVDAAQAKAEWKRLRDIYRDSLKRRRFKNITPWKFSKDMAFLKPVMYNRKPENNLNLKQSEMEDLAQVVVKDEPEFLLGDGGPADYLEQPDVLEESADDSRESLKRFFLSMYDSSVLLPKAFQLRIKRSVFEAVMAAEEEALKSLQLTELK